MRLLLFRIGLLEGHLLARNLADKSEVAENADYDNAYRIDGEKRLVRHGIQQEARNSNPSCHQKRGDAAYYAEPFCVSLPQNGAKTPPAEANAATARMTPVRMFATIHCFYVKKNVKAVRFRVGECSLYAEVRPRVFTNFPSVGKKTWGRAAANRAILIQLA